jgi:hypothetical protein
MGVEIREKLDQYHLYCQQRDLIKQQEKKEKELKFTAEKLHHILSTAQQRGVLDPPPEVLEVRGYVGVIKYI